MAAGIPARLTAAEGRKFGLTVGLAFIAFGGIALWRGKQRTSMVLFGLGGVLVLAGLIVPTMLGPVERAWMGLSHLISKVTTPIFMSIVYFLVLTPTGLLRRLKGNEMLSPKPSDSRWEPHQTSASVPERMERQF